MGVVDLERISGSFGNHKQHFHTIKKFVPDLTGYAIFDGDGKKHDVFEENGLKIRFWENYEIENYFYQSRHSS